MRKNELAERYADLVDGGPDEDMLDVVAILHAAYPRREPPVGVRTSLDASQARRTWLWKLPDTGRWRLAAFVALAAALVLPLLSHRILGSTSGGSIPAQHVSQAATQTVGGFSITIKHIAAGPGRVTITYSLGKPSWWSQEFGQTSLGQPVLIDAHGREFPAVSDAKSASSASFGTRAAQFDVSELTRHGALSGFRLQFAPIELTTQVQAIHSTLQATPGVIPVASLRGIRTVRVVPIPPQQAPIIVVHSYGPFTFQVTIPSARLEHRGPSSPHCPGSLRTCR